ncbi:MAG TPA: TIGR01620 family protein [Devosiaceae bacterium]|nr:TIGR01620 family protein [Devosiaceae bacterium]
MTRPVARTVRRKSPPAAGAPRGPAAFEISRAEIEAAPPAAFTAADELVDPVTQAELRPRGRFWSRAFWGALGLLVSLGLALAAERFVTDLFARYQALGWAALGLVAVIAVALGVLLVRETVAIMRLRKLARLQQETAAAHAADDIVRARVVTAELAGLYAGRADLARAGARFEADAPGVFDGAELIRLAERDLMGPLDARARALIATSSRRIAVVTAVSPRALVDLAFVGFESVRLSRRIAELYGGRPGFFGFWRLARAILGHLAITGGVALGDSVVQQLLGHGLAARLSARLGEGVINGLMTVRVGIAAMKVIRPTPFLTQKQPVVTDFMAELARLTGEPKS